MAEERSRGWRIMQGGEAELERTLDMVLADHRSGGLLGVNYGQLSYFLNENTDASLDPVRNQVILHARKNIRVGGNSATLFGQPIASIERIPIARGSEVLKVSRSHLTNVIRALTPGVGMVANGRRLLDRQLLLTVHNAACGTMSSIEACKVLGLRMSTIKLALQRGLLDCLAPQSLNRPALVWRRSVDKVLSEIISVPVVVSTELLDPLSYSICAGISEGEVFASVMEVN